MHIRSLLPTVLTMLRFAGDSFKFDKRCQHFISGRGLPEWIGIEKILPRPDRKFYLAVTVIVVVVHEPTYPAGRLCDVMLWPPGPLVVTLVVNPALLQIDWARFNRTPIKLGTVH